MARTTFSGHEIIGVLTDLGYVPVSREGSHIRLRSENADTGAVRLVDAPQHDEVRIDIDDDAAVTVALEHQERDLSDVVADILDRGL